MSKIVSTYPVQCPAVDLAHTGFCHELLSFAGADLTVLIAIVQGLTVARIRQSCPEAKDCCTTLQSEVLVDTNPVQLVHSNLFLPIPITHKNH